MKGHILLLIFCCLIISFSLTEISATTLVELSLEQMCFQSNEILQAKVISIQSYRDPDMGNHIFTDIEIEIIDNLKGNLKKNSKHIVKMFGGTIDGKTTMIVGSPCFIPEEELMLFLKSRDNEKGPQKKYSVIGISLGKFDIVLDKQTGEKKVKRNQTDTPLKVKLKDTNYMLDGPQKVKLNDFKNLIIQLIGGQ